MSETRDILNEENEVVGSVTLPDDTPETEWGNLLGCYALPVVIPDVSPRQIRTALILSGVSLTDIDTALNSLSEPMKSIAKIEWEYSVSFQRDRDLVNSVGQMLGWTSDQLDALWHLAGSL